MTNAEFKKKYFVDNFYWVDRETSPILQMIGLEMGCVTTTGSCSIIKWFPGLVNLTYRTSGGCATVCQRQCFLTSNETATDLHEMFLEYGRRD